MSSQVEKEKKSQFSLNLRALMAKNGFSQRALATALGITQAAVSQWLNETTAPKSGELEKLSDLFHLTMDDLWRGNVESGEDKRAADDYWKERAKKAEAKITKLIPTCRNLAATAQLLTDIIEE